MELWNDALVTPCEGQSRRRLSHLRLSANTAMLRTACFLCVIGHRELLGVSPTAHWQREKRDYGQNRPRAPGGVGRLEYGTIARDSWDLACEQLHALRFPRGLCEALGMCMAGEQVITTMGRRSPLEAAQQPRQSCTVTASGIVRTR